jgi:hypothetical protein
METVKMTVTTTMVPHPKTPRLIGLHGRLHSGKDSAYSAIVEAASPKSVRRVAFADKLKMSALAALGVQFKDTADALRICDRLKEAGQISVEGLPVEGIYAQSARLHRIWLHRITGREFLQLYGTESHRNIFGNDFWVEALLPSQGDTSIFSEDVVVVTDVRFVNEADRILKYGGEVWRIDADKRLGPLPSGSHVSEQPLPDKYITRVVDNNADLKHYMRQVEVAYNG